MSWQEFIEAVAKANFEFAWQRPLILAQAILESGRGTSELSKYHNMNGMKYRESIAIPGAEKFWYKTITEPDPPGGDWFFKFDSYRTAIEVWKKFFFRKDGTWIPYPEVYKRNPEVLKDVSSFLNYVGPIYCPFFEKNHHQTYADYIMNQCFPEAQNLLNGEDVRKAFKVAIMPGHGGNAPGAVNNNLGATEAKYNWLEAQEIKRILEADGNYQVTICRQENENVGLSNFQNRANNTNADVCLCLHHNAFNGQAKGWILFNTKQTQEERKFIQIMAHHFQELPLNPRGCCYASPDSYKAVWNCIHKCNLPTILFESCFIDNNEDCRWLMEGGYKQIARKICNGVKEYLEGELVSYPYTVVVNDANPPLNVRSGAGTNYSVVGTLNNGTSLTVVENNGGGWLHISTPISGWVAESLTQRQITVTESQSYVPVSV